LKELSSRDIETVGFDELFMVSLSIKGNQSIASELYYSLPFTKGQTPKGNGF